MSKDSFLLVSLKENKAKKLAQVISNESCRKILDFLAHKEGTESEIAKELMIPMPTVHYNLKILMQAGLVKAEEFHYSKKGREVNHYSLSNKYIIIAPESTHGLKSKLKSILPVLILVGITGTLLEVFRGTFSRSTFSAAKEVMMSGSARTLAQPVMEEAAPMMMDAVTYTADAGVKAVNQTMLSQPSVMHAGYWFFIGAVVALGLYLLIDWFWKRKA